MSNNSRHHYFVPATAPYPYLVALGLFCAATGFIFYINKHVWGSWFSLIGLALVLVMAFKWFSQVVQESQKQSYTTWEDRSFRNGMVWFIASEVMFFAAFFGALYHLRIHAVPTLGVMEDLHGVTLWPGFLGGWPTAGPAGKPFTPMHAFGVPAVNTALLLASGLTVTWAHKGLLHDNRRQLIAGLFLTVLLGVIFLGLQAYEYHHAYTELGLTLGSGAYGATFFMLTGFHGFHVTLGAIMLIVILLRSMKGHFTPQHHFAFEAVAWYWHFVDVVWLLLFVFVYVLV